MEVANLPDVPEEFLLDCSQDPLPDHHPGGQIESPDVIGSDCFPPITEGELNSAQCLLFAAGRPVSIAEFAGALQISEPRSRQLLETLLDRFQPGGLEVVRIAGGFQMTTRPEYAEVLNRFFAPPAQRLSPAALETVALIAYRQPVTLPEIEAVRGVKSDSPVRTLLERGFIEDAGRKDATGRPVLYRTTPNFLAYLGVESLEDLPPLESTDPILQDGDCHAASESDSRQLAGVPGQKRNGFSAEDSGRHTTEKAPQSASSVSSGLSNSRLSNSRLSTARLSNSRLSTARFSESGFGKIAGG